MAGSDLCLLFFVVTHPKSVVFCGYSGFCHHIKPRSINILIVEINELLCKQKKNNCMSQHLTKCHVTSYRPARPAHLQSVASCHYSVFGQPRFNRRLMRRLKTVQAYICYHYSWTDWIYLLLVIDAIFIVFEMNLFKYTN